MKQENNSSEEFSTSAELRSYVENNLSSENTDVYSHAGLTHSDELLEFLNFFEAVYDSSHPELPYNFKDTQLGQQLRKASATKLASNAVSEGNISQMKYISGKQSYNSDANSIHTLINLRQKLGKSAYIQYLFGHMGNGKTDFAILQAELAYKEMGYKVVTNIKSLAHNNENVTYVYTYGDLLYHLAGENEVSDIDEAQEFDINEDILFIFDEASSHASGYSDDAYETQKKLGVLVKKIRKVGGNMIIIGHTGKDVHPDIRRITNDCVHKVSKKTVEFYHSVENGEGKGLKDTISRIPKTNWNSYDTNEITSWDWTDVLSGEMNETLEQVEDNKESKEKRNMRIAKAVMDNEHPEIEVNEKGKITNSMIAQHYDLSKGRISQIMKELENKAKGA